MQYEALSAELERALVRQLAMRYAFINDERFGGMLRPPLLVLEWLQPQLFPLYAGAGLVTVGSLDSRAEDWGSANVRIGAAAQRWTAGVLTNSAVPPALAIAGRVSGKDSTDSTDSTNLALLRGRRSERRAALPSPPGPLGPRSRASAEARAKAAERLPPSAPRSPEC